MATAFQSNAFQTTALAFQIDVGRSKDYSIDGIPIPFTDDAYDSALARLREKRRQILHEDQLAIDIIVQAVVNRMLK